jgi:branched-chain amino acid transport system ATP-binding protein
MSRDHHPELATSPPLLDVHGIDVAYGSVIAARRVNMQVHRGEIVALLGANGAGKSSVLRAVTGLVRPRSGRIRFAGERIDGRSPTAVVAAGLAHVPEGRRVFPGLTVADNLELGAWQCRVPLHERHEVVFGLFPRLAERRTQLAGSLSGGEQQMLAIGRALMADPQLIAIDELSLGLAPVIVDQLIEGLVALNRDGLSIVLVEQFVHRALGVADRVYAMAKGTVVFSASAEEARASGRLEDAYLAGTVG